MIRSISPLAAALALVLAGCAVGPDYQRPASTLPAAYAESSDRALNVDCEWWRAFNDEQLDALIERALKDSTDVRIAVAKVEQADAVLRQAGAALFPEFDLDAAANRGHISSLTANPPSASTLLTTNSFKLALSTSFELDFWGKLRRARESAFASAEASRYARDTVRLTLAGQVASAYISLRSNDAQLVATRATLKTREDAFAIAQRRYASGTSSRLDLEQASNSLASARAQLASQIQARALSANLLALLVGDPALTPAEASLDALPVPPVPAPGLPASLLDARPDVRQAEAQLVSANANIGVAKAALFPSISLTGSFGGQSGDLSKLFDAGAKIWSAGATLDLPIFDAGRRSAKVDEIRAVQVQALEQYRKSAETAYREVRDALVSATQAAEAEKQYREALESALKVEKISRARYEAGSAAFLELLDAQRSSNDARIAFIKARQSRLVAAVDLYKALGGGWKAPR